MDEVQGRKEYLCERCGRLIKQRGKCLPCNYLYKHKKYFGGLKESPDYDLSHGIDPNFVKEIIDEGWNKKENEIKPQGDYSTFPIIKNKLYSRRLATEYKYATICLFSLFIISILFMLVAPEIIAVPLLFLIVGSLLISTTFFKNYVLWTNGARGEEKVIKELKKLGEGFLIINDLKLPNHKGNIDHIVLSRNGVFVIETKNYKGEIKCYGDDWELENKGIFKIFNKQIESPSKQLKGNILRLKEYLKQYTNFPERLWFESIVVFPNENLNLKEIKNPTVTVLKLDELNKYINSYQKATLAQKEISLLTSYLTKLQIEEENITIFKNILSEIKTQVKFPDYRRYVKFGLIFGFFWLLFDEIFYYSFNEYFYYNIQSLIYLPFTGGLIPFLLGKFFLDIMNIKLQSKLANLMLISLIGWLPFLLEFWIFIGFIDYITTTFVCILARFALVIPVMFVFHALKWRI